MLDQKMLTLLERSFDATEELLGGVDEQRWTSASPCEDMDAHTLVEHLVGGLVQFAAVGAGTPVADISFERTFPVGGEAHEYDAAGDRMLSVWSESGVAGRTYSMPWGDTPGSALLGFMLIEQVTHGWDIAKAIGREPPYDTELVEATLDLAREYDDEMIRVPGMFAPAVTIDDDAPAIDRLAAFLGRHPDRW